MTPFRISIVNDLFTLSRASLLLSCLLVPSFAPAETTPETKQTPPVYELSDAGYLERPELEFLIHKLEGHPNLTRERLTKLFANVKQQKSILEAISRPAERTMTWASYRPIFITESRIDGGVAFWKKHQETLHRASQEFKVPQEIIVAIIGVETRYGQHAGRYRVLDALTTLGFDYPPRRKFFYKELEQFLLLEEYAGIDIEKTLGSYAGAMGYGQFIPSSYRHYAVDFDNDGKIDLLNNPVDAIGSVANYFAKHGWKAGEPVASTAYIKPQQEDTERLDTLVNIDGLKPKHRIKDFAKFGLYSNENFESNAKASAYQLSGEKGNEYWLCLDNFYVITRYNHSKLYAMAVFQLSEYIKLKKEFGNPK